MSRVLMIILLSLSLSSCRNGSEFYLKPNDNCSQERIVLNPEIPVTYRGLILGEAKLLENGELYKVNLLETEFSFLPESKLFMIPRNLTKTSFEVAVDTISVYKREVSQKDTMFFYCSDSAAFSGYMDRILRGVKEIVDTLTVK